MFPGGRSPPCHPVAPVVDRGLREDDVQRLWPGQVRVRGEDPPVAMQYGPIMGPVGEQLTIPTDAGKRFESDAAHEANAAPGHLHGAGRRCDQHVHALMARRARRASGIHLLQHVRRPERHAEGGRLGDADFPRATAAPAVPLVLRERRFELWRPCISCHSVSANSSTMAATQHYYAGSSARASRRPRTTFRRTRLQSLLRSRKARFRRPRSRASPPTANTC